MRRMVACLLAVLVLLGPLGSTGDGFSPHWGAFDAAPGSPSAISGGYWWGTDELGRDVWVRLCLGLRGSLFATGFALAVAAAMGALLGVLTGFMRGLGGVIAARIVDLLAAMPLVLVALVLVAAMGRSVLAVAVTLGLLGAVPVARAVRVGLRSASAAPHFTVARLHGATGAELLRWYFLPSIGAACRTACLLLFPQLLIAEGTLGFLGLSVPDPGMTLGSLMAESAARVTQVPWMVATPALLVFLVLFAVRER